jgi:hypothetical protein
MFAHGRPHSLDGEIAAPDGLLFPAGRCPQRPRSLSTGDGDRSKPLTALSPDQDAGTWTPPCDVLTTLS